MTMVNRLKAAAVVLGLATAITSTFVWGDATGGKTTVGGLNPGNVKLSDDIMSNRFSKQPVLTYETQTGDTLFAVQIKPTLPAVARARDIVVVVDTSASQAGKFLALSRMVVDQIVQDSSPSDRVSLWSINTPGATRNLSSGLKDAHNKAHVIAMAHALDNEYASGAVDLKNGIEKVLGDFDGKVLRQQVVVFIGDAESACAPLSENERYQLANKVREAKVQFFAVPIGSAINGLNMHTLVTGTGGGVARFGDYVTNAKKAVADIVKELHQSMNVPVLFPTKWNFATEAAERYPTRLPPLRADVSTLIVGKFPKGKIPAKFEGTIEGRLGGAQASVSVSEVVPAASPQNFFLNAIVRQWSESSIKDAPSILRADRTLAMAYEQGRLNRDECLTQSQMALGMSQINAARNLAIAAEKIDPNDGEVKALIKVIDKLDKGELTIEKLKAATGQQIGVRYEKRDNGELVAVRVNLDEIASADPALAPKVPNTVPVGDPQALLKQEQARRAILEQQVRLTVEETLSRGRELLRNADPRAAKDLLLAQRDSIKSNPDIGEALRTKLLDQMDKLLTDVGQRGEKIVREKAEENERIARARAKVMSIDNDRSREERTRDRIKAFANLMAQARYEDAYREALVLNQESVNEGRPVPIESAATYQMGQAAGNLREMRELTRIREDRFLLTMLQVEKSHIPYPDEPPVHFPPSKVWRDLTDIRKRYSNSELDTDLPPRVLRRMEFLKSALENPIPEIPAGEQPLPFLLENIAGFASPPGFDKDPSRKVTILINASEFKKEDMAFDPEKQQIKFPSKLVGVSLATVLRLISEQIDGTYWVRRDYIEIVPANYAIKEKVVRVFPVGDLIIGIPNAINQSSLSQSLAVLGAQFSLGGGGQPIGGIGGFQGGALGLGGGGAGGAGGGGAPIGGVFNGGARGAGGGVAGFGGGIQGQFGNLGGQFGFQGADYGPTLVALITEVIAKNEWTINNNDVIGQGGMGGMDPDPAAQGLPADQLNRIGYWPPSRGLIITGTSRFHRGESSKLKKKDAAPVNFIPGNNQVNAGKPAGNVAVAKVDPKNPNPKNVVVVAKGEIDVSATVQEIIANNKNLDPETLYQALLSKGKADPGYIIACVDFMVKCRQFKHAAELLKTSLRTGIIAEPWAQESLAIALEGSQASAEEIERAKLSAIDLAPKSPYAYLKASKAMAEMGDPDRALKYCRLAARFEPNLPDPYINALAYASDKKATLDADVSTWAAGNLLTRDWTTDAAEYHLRAHEHLKEMSAKFAARNMLDGAKKIQMVLDDEKNRDLVIELLWSGQADLDLKVREPIGTTCSSLNKRTSGGGVLQGDDFTQKDDNRGETYTAAEAFTGTYLVSVDRVWGRSLDNKVNVKVTKNQGTPEQTVELHTLNLKEQTSLTINFESGRRKNLASVPPIGVPVDAMRKPEREQEVMNKLRAMTNGTSPGMVGMSGGTGTAAQHQGLMGSDESQSPFLEMSVNTNVASSVPGGFEMSKQTVVSKDGRRMQIKVAPVFQTTGGTSRTKLKLDFIPGSE